MNESQQGLYERISQFSFDEGDVELSFARRLARENGWAADYAGRAIEEYRRFIFLAVVAGHPVTPSDQNTSIVDTGSGRMRSPVVWGGLMLTSTPSNKSFCRT